MFKLQNYINGELVAPINGNYIDNYDPSVGEVYSLIPDSTAADVDLAVQAAKAAFPAWSNLSNEQRHDYIMAIANGIEKRFEELVEAESRDNGKPIKLARKVDIPRAVSNFKFYATAVMHYSSQSHFMPEEPAINYTLRQPLGVVGCISPWNLPLYLFTWKIAPALATGNTVVAKPSEITPMTAYLLSEICVEAGLPKGVLNIVHGNGPNAGEAIVQHDDIKAISFTGGTKTGEHIARIVAPKFKKMSLELGGKNPNIIFDDCDYDKALSTSVISSFANQGQICLCGSRIFIHETIYERFRDDFIAKVKKLKIGDPMEGDTSLGAVVSKSHQEKVLSYIELAKQEGGKVIAGGNAVHPVGRCANGYFIEPTVIEGLAFNCRTNQEEIFGPVVTLQPFSTEEEVLGYANSVKYGLAATVWTQDISRANRVAQQLHSGIVWVNCWLLRDLRTPFGGVKDSGMGREGGFEAMDFFTEPKNICVKY
jgi:aminomuconate-semialdehyde/2-hydroxymuconate-6-semialdehyde dehydrogenase